MTKLLLALRRSMPRAPEEWLLVMEDQMPISGIDTPHEIASFVAQIAHESNELTRLEENLSYRAERLVQVWPRRFPTIEFSKQYELNPVELANFVYANRLGNGDTDSGDGWRFHGRGPIQLTGRRNYTACGNDISADLITNPGQLLKPFIGIRSALWFWRTMNLDELDDDADVRLETRRVNGGEHGLVQRQAYFDACLKYLEE